MNQPSETARYLASYILDNHHVVEELNRYAEWPPDSTTIEQLAKTIQEFYDKLP